MADGKKRNEQGIRELSDEELAGVAGGWGTYWSQEDEDRLLSDYRAANPDNPNPTDSELDIFIEGVGLRDGIDDSLVYNTLMARMNYLTMRSGV